MIIMLIVGFVAVLLLLFLPHVTHSTRGFGAAILLTWTVFWSIALWYMYYERHTAAGWWLLLLAVGLTFLFVILVGIMRLGSNV